MKENEEECHKIQKFTLQNIETIYKLLWELMTSDISMTDFQARYLYMNIYR